MRYRRTVLIAVLASVLIAPSLFAQTLMVKVQRGNVRSGPGKSYPVIGRVQKADNFPIEARQEQNVMAWSTPDRRASL